MLKIKHCKTRHSYNVYMTQLEWIRSVPSLPTTMLLLQSLYINRLQPHCTHSTHFFYLLCTCRNTHYTDSHFQGRSTHSPVMVKLQFSVVVVEVPGSSASCSDDTVQPKNSRAPIFSNFEVFLLNLKIFILDFYP